MSQQTYRANLSSKQFPFVAFQQGNTIIIPGADQAYTRFGTESERNRDVNAPSLYYGHNFMPTTEGYVSIGYAGIVGGQYYADAVGTYLRDFDYTVYAGATPTPATLTLNAVRAVFGIDSSYTLTRTAIILECRTYVSLNNFTYARYNIGYNAFTPDIPLGQTVSKIAETNPPGNVDVDTNTYAILNGKQYTFSTVDAIGTKVFAELTNLATPEVAAAVPQTLIGISLTQIKGIFSSNGYLCLYTKTSIAWSSTTNYLDFTPSLISGAGSATLQNLTSDILFIRNNSTGFIVYTAQEAICAKYTGNIRFPFSFVVIPGSFGAISSDQFAGTCDDGSHLLLTSAGIQKVYTNKAVLAFVELNEFITAGVTYSYDLSTNVFTAKQPADFLAAGAGYTDSSTGHRILGKLRLNGSRYLTYSYGVVPYIIGSSASSIEYFNYILVYDILLDRWGHLKRKHVDVLDLGIASIYFNQVAGQNVKPSEAKVFPVLGFALLSESGKLLVPTFEWNAVDSVLILGSYKYVRNNRIVVDELNLQGNSVRSTGLPGMLYTNTVADIIPSVDGQIQNTPISGYSVDSVTSNYRNYLFSADVYNFSVRVQGSFNITSLTFSFHIGAKI